MEDSAKIEEFNVIQRDGILRSIVNGKRAVQRSPGFIHPLFFQIKRPETIED